MAEKKKRSLVNTMHENAVKGFYTLPSSGGQTLINMKGRTPEDAVKKLLELEEEEKKRRRRKFFNNSDHKD